MKTSPKLRYFMVRLNKKPIEKERLPALDLMTKPCVSSEIQGFTHKIGIY